MIRRHALHWGMRCGVIVTAVAVILGSAGPALAQRYPFERSFDVADGVTLNVQTTRGKIEVKVGPPGRVLVSGAATVGPVGMSRRTRSSSPSSSLQARRSNNRAMSSGSDLQLNPAQERAVTVNYVVTVPPRPW